MLQKSSSGRPLQWSISSTFNFVPRECSFHGDVRCETFGKALDIFPSNSISKCFHSARTLIWFLTDGLIWFKPFHDFVSSGSQANIFHPKSVWLVQKAFYTIPSYSIHCGTFEGHVLSINHDKSLNSGQTHHLVVPINSLMKPWVKLMSADYIGIYTEYNANIMRIWVPLAP